MAGEHDFGVAEPVVQERPRPPKSHKKKTATIPQPGERVAANIGEVTAGPGAQEWIVAVVVQYLPEELAFEAGRNLNPTACSSCTGVPVHTRGILFPGLATRSRFSST